jgi:hypothetical protein
MKTMSATEHTGEETSADKAVLDRQPRIALEPKRFKFAHKVFSVPGAFFERDDHNNEPVLKVDLGDLRAAMTFETLRASFGLTLGSPDDLALTDVGKALAFVRSVRPGDTIPAELLDGSASWRVEPRHLATAQGRITAGLLAWLGEGTSAESPVELAALGADASIKAKVQMAFGRLATRMGLPESRRGEVVDALDRLANELSYIEALREKVDQTRRLVELFKRLRTAYKRERGASESLERIVHLLERPVRRYEYRLAEVDAQTGEIQNTIIHLARQVAFVREARDWLHREIMLWDTVLTTWSGESVEPSHAQQRKISAAYRFAARYFPIVEEWAHG